jgi:hypothetical protein
MFIKNIIWENVEVISVDSDKCITIKNATIDINGYYKNSIRITNDNAKSYSYMDPEFIYLTSKEIKLSANWWCCSIKIGAKEKLVKIPVTIIGKF